MSKITARFYVTEIRKSTMPYIGVTLTPAYREGQNKAWASATPSGKIDLNIGADLPAAEFFEAALASKADIAITFELSPEWLAERAKAEGE